MDALWQLKPIGHMKSVFHFKNGTPRQPAVCSHARGSVTIDKSVFNNPEHSLEGLEQFSHVWVMFLFHKNNNAHTKAKVKPPRLDGKRVGVFSTRSPYRPNAIGLTLAAIDKIQGATVYLKGIDILDGTPILDIKPYIQHYDAPGVQQFSHTYDTVSDGVSDMSLSNTASYDGITDEVVASLGQELVRERVHSDRDSCSRLSVRSEISDQIESEHADTSFVDESSPNFEDIPSPQKSGHGNGESAENNEPLQKEVPLSLDSRGETTPGGLTAGAVTKCQKKDVETSSYSFSQHSEDKTIKTADWIRHSTVRKLDVRFTPTAGEQLKFFSPNHPNGDYKLHMFSSVSDVEAAIHQVLNEDPRSVYRRNKCKDSLYFFAIDNVHVTCWFDDGIAEVVKIQPVTAVPQCS